MNLFNFSTRKSPSNTFFSLVHTLSFSDRILIHVVFALLVVSGISALMAINAHFTQTVPIAGGTFTEGIVGSPRFANPVLATTRSDKDVNALVFAGVMQYDSRGELTPYLAEEVTLSEDGTTYTISLRKDIRFHDGSQLTAEDVVFTYDRIKHPETKSPLRGNWNTATITETGTHTLTITLPEPYVPFIENFTVGILPAHIWQSISPQDMPYSVHNTEPIGSGPFMIDSVTRTNHGTVETYNLIANPYSIHTPFLSQVTLQFYDTAKQLQQDLENGNITSTADIPLTDLEQYEDSNFTIHSAPVPQIFAIFFNQNRSDVLRQKVVRTALNESLDRTQLIEDALLGYAIPSTNTRPANLNELQSDKVSTSSDRIENARELLRNNGWQRNDDGIWQYSSDDENLTLSLTLQTVNNPTLAQATESVAQQWRELGAEVKVEQYEQSNLVNSIIRPRMFEAVLFGVEIGRQNDLYPFWHSSQQTDPGLNIAQYANISMDEKLETLRRETNQETRLEIRSEVYEILAEEIPAVFLYTPTVNYLTANSLRIDTITFPEGAHDRLRYAAQWHNNTDTLWPIFHKNYAINQINE